MAQEINVVAMRKQITTKLKALEDAIKAYDTANKKYDADRKAAATKYEKDIAAWNTKVAKALIKSIKPEDVRLSLRGRNNRYQGVSIELDNVDLSAFGEQPTWNAYDYDAEAYRKVQELYRAIPDYYDSYNRTVSAQSVVFHFKKALDLLDVLPAGTTSIQVKDYNFLTKF